MPNQQVCESVKNLYIKRLAKLNKEQGFLASLEKNFPYCESLNVLIIGAGDYPLEIDALEEFFAAEDLRSEQKSTNSSLHFIVTEIDPEAIAICQKKYKHKKNMEFHVLDATLLENVEKVLNSRSVQIVSVRHPVLWSSNPVSQCFATIFTTTVPHVVSRGATLLVSLYHEEERDALLSLMNTVTEDKFIELENDSTIEWCQEVRPTHLTDRYVSCFSDQYFIAYVNFVPNLAIQVEKKTGLFKADSGVCTTNAIIQALTKTLEKCDEDTSQTVMGNALLVGVQAAKKAVDDRNVREEFVTEVVAKAIDSHTWFGGKNVQSNCPSIKNECWQIVKQRNKPNVLKALLSCISAAVVRTSLVADIDTEQGCLEAIRLVLKRPEPTCPQQQEGKVDTVVQQTQAIYPFF